MDQGQNVRPSPIAGQWYSADSARLAAQVDNYIHKAHLPDFTGKIIAVMAPHAGYRYSGPVAGHAFAALHGLKPELVCIVSPMHYPYNQPLMTTAHQAYATPLGSISVDLDAIEKLDRILIKELGLGLARITNDPEHSLEIELPFLQRTLENPFKLLPIMVRDQSVAVMQKLGLALADVLQGQAALLVASTDLSHYYPQETAHKLDAEVLRQVEAFDPAGVIRVDELGKGFACGHGALASVMWAAKALGADHAEILNYATSGDITGDFTQVVGYGAALFTSASVASTGNAIN